MKSRDKIVVVLVSMSMSRLHQTYPGTNPPTHQPRLHQSPRWNPCLDARSRFDIGGIGSDSNRSGVGLQKLARAIVGVEMVKSKKVSMSDWSQIPLTNAQLCFASRDAWAGAAVMENIGRMHDVMQVDSIASLVKGDERSMADVMWICVPG